MQFDLKLKKLVLSPIKLVVSILELLAIIKVNIEHSTVYHFHINDNSSHNIKQTARNLIRISNEQRSWLDSRLDLMETTREEYFEEIHMNCGDILVAIISHSFFIVQESVTPSGVESRYEYW